MAPKQELKTCFSERLRAILSRYIIKLRGGSRIFQRGGCKYESSAQTSQGQRNGERGRVKVRVRVMFEYVDFLHFDY